MEQCISNKLKQRKSIVWLLLFSAVFSFSIVLSKHISYSGKIYGKYSDNTISCLEFQDVFVFIIAMVVSFAMIYGASMLIEKGKCFLITDQRIRNPKKKYIIWIISMVVFSLCWLPYLLTYMPGAVYVDAFISIYQAIAGQFGNHHPVIYTLYIKLIVVDIGMKIGDLGTGIMLYTMIQYLIMATILGYFVSWLHQKGATKLVVITVTVWFALFPLYPFYAVAMWKDTPFALALFLYVLSLIDIIQSGVKGIHSKSTLIRNIIVGIFVAFLRNKAIIIVMVSALAICIINRKTFKKCRMFIIANLIMIVVVMFIQGPMYDHFKWSSRFAENLGIPLQQIARVAASEGNMTEEQYQFLDTMCGVDELKEYYAPCIVDSVKWMPTFNNRFLEENKAEFFKVWLSMFWNNKKQYIDAVLLENAGFWNLDMSGPEAYVQAGVWENEVNIKQTDYFYQIFGFRLSKFVVPDTYISMAVFAWIMLGCFSIMMYKRKYALAMGLIPLVLLWLMALIATPIAISLRYVYVLVLILPLLPILPMLKEDNLDEK